ncbi:unnamed protein product, partial [Soboliphyme baturini]|uniref:Quaking_NLS domain-containing protein n=1 Tax=Soboliphyme baturini TaxID=241478 RepID=A0A183IA79_9BILA
MMQEHYRPTHLQTSTSRKRRKSGRTSLEYARR